MLRPTKTTPIKLPQVYIELPKTGVSNLLAANSNDMVAIPAINTKTRITICKEVAAGFKNNTYFLMLCIVDFIYMV